MAKSESPIPATSIQPADISSSSVRVSSGGPGPVTGRVQMTSGAAATASESSIDEESRGILSEAEQDSALKTLVKGIFAEYYTRGIHVLKPEIVLTSEFVPIRKSFENQENTGLNVDFGNGQFGVTGVLKLLELHQVVQQSVNESSKAYMSAVIQGANPADVLAAFRDIYTDQILGESLEATVDKFVVLAQNDISSSIQLHVYGVTAQQAAAESSSDASAEPSTTPEPSYVSLRDLVLSAASDFAATSSENSIEMIRALAEVVIIEKVMLAVGTYFRDLVLLRKKILELISIPHMKSGDSGVTSHLNTRLKELFQAIDKFKTISSEADGAPDGMVMQNPESMTVYGGASGATSMMTQTPIGTVTYGGAGVSTYGAVNTVAQIPSAEKASNYLSGQDIAKYGLDAASISSAESNLLVLYQLFYKVLSLLDPAYCNLSSNHSDYSYSLSALEDRAQASFGSEETRRASARLLDFFKRIGLSSFWTGNIIKRSGEDHGMSLSVRDRIYTSIPHCARDDLKNFMYVFDAAADASHGYGRDFIAGVLFGGGQSSSNTNFSIGDRSTYSGYARPSSGEVSQANLTADTVGVAYGKFKTGYRFLNDSENPRGDGYSGGHTVDMSNDLCGYKGLHSMRTGVNNENPRTEIMTPGVVPYGNARIIAGELLSIVCFDLVLDLNRVSSMGVTQIGGAASSTFISSGHTGLREYFRVMLGNHGVPDSHMATTHGASNMPHLYNSATHQASVHQFYKIVNPNGYQAGSAVLEKGYADTGVFHNVIFGNYPIIETPTSSATTGNSINPDDVAMLPSEVSFIDTAYKHLPGNIGIISEAFVNDDFTQFDKYINNLSAMVEAFTEDMLHYTSVAQTDEIPVPSDLAGSSSGAEGKTPSPSYHARLIMKAFGDGILSQYRSTKNEWSDLSARFSPIVLTGGQTGEELEARSLTSEEVFEAMMDDIDEFLASLEDDGSLNAEYTSFQEDRDIKRYILPLLFLTAAGEDDSDASQNILCALVGNIHYNHMLQYRGQRDHKNERESAFSGTVDMTPEGLYGHSDYSCREWFQYGAFDNLNKMLYYLGTEKFAGEPTENDEFYRWHGQFKDYLGNQGYTDVEKACFPPSLIRGKKALLGPSSTAELFESVERTLPDFIKARNQLHMAYLEMNDTLTDVFQSQGLISDEGIKRVEVDDEGYGDIINEPVLKLKRRIDDLHSGYSQSRQIWGTTFDRLIGMYDGLYIGESDESDTVYASNYYVPFNETLAVTQGPHQTNDTQRDFATINAMAQVLGSSLNVRLEGDQFGLRVYVLPHQMQAVTDALRGIEKKSSTELISHNSNNDFMKQSVFEGLSESESVLQEYLSLQDGLQSDGYQLYSLTYDNCMSALSDIMKPVYDKENSIRVCLSAIIKHVSNLNRVREEIVSITDSSKRSTLTNLGLKFADQVVSEGMTMTTETGERLQDIKVQLLRYMTQASLPTYYKNVFELVCESESSPVYPASESLSASQFKMMSIALTGIENMGLSEDEKMGKKTIVNVGIPSNLIDNLQYQAFVDLDGTNSATSGGAVIDSPYICIQLYKKDSIGGNLLYYPKLFLFNTDLFIIENYKNSTASSLGIGPVAQLSEASEISSFEELYEKFEMCKVDYESSSNQLMKVSGESGMLSKGDDLEYLDNSNDFITGGTSGQGLRSLAQREMKINHMLDYYLKTYLKLSTGIDTNEYVFPLKPSAAINQDISAGRSDAARRSDLRQRLQNELILSYPSANVDPVLAAELFRMDNNIAKSNIFTAFEKCKNLISPKCFSRVFTMFVNESDFVVYPYPLKWESIPHQTFSTPGTQASTNTLINSLREIYDPSPKFSLGPERQLSGISREGKSQVLYSNVVSNVLAGLTHGAGNLLESDAWQGMGSDTVAMVKHMNDVEGEASSDVYEIFATVSLVRRK